MEKSRKRKQVNKRVTEVQTFPVPFNLVTLKENMCISTNLNTHTSKENIIEQAYKLHSPEKV